ncbi:MAG: hypothetical protein E7335_11340 [Clostridiales bacterium]|nr:hypothetical protein [Clostridiales bacterium]
MKDKMQTAIRYPETGVQLTGGLLHSIFENNITYLLSSYALEDLQYPFRIRKGENAPRVKPLSMFWETELEGSNAGRFLMGAGNSLRYCENPQLRQRLDALVAEIERTSDEDGYIMGFKKEDMMILERANYTRSWLTRGLIAAGTAGNETAWKLIRRFGDWFNNYPNAVKAPQLHFGYQGMIANTKLARSKVGSEADIESAKRLYVENEWLERLKNGDTTAIWRRANDSTHGYELNAMISYVDLYILTGEEQYLEAVLAAYEMFKRYWKHIDGSVAICEEHDGLYPYPPASRHISADRHTGETCNNVWWLLLNQQLHMLYPNEEKYVAEIERTLYNSVITAQEEGKGIRYHSFLHGVRDDGYAENTCCEGTATLLYGMLPELVFALSDKGVWVNLFASARIEFEQCGAKCTLAMETAFPEKDNVSLQLSCTTPAEFEINIRIPSWADEAIPVAVNGEIVQCGEPGSYLKLKRRWNNGDEISFVLKRSIRIHRYFGFTTVRGYERYAFMHGPILMAVTGEHVKLDQERIARNEKYGHDARSRFNDVHWILDIDPSKDIFDENPDKQHSLKPYYTLQPGEMFTCYPLVAQRASENKISARESHRTGLYRQIDLPKGEKLLLAGIPAGEFDMGQEGFEPCELPIHKVKIEKDFFMGAFQVTQAQYEAVMGYNPSELVGENRPVECVSWEDAQVFIARVNELLKDEKLQLRLPTEQEWEYAARGGTKDIPAYATDVLRDLGQYGWCYLQLGAAAVQTQSLPVSWPVGMRHQNAWGLYDMLGNVGEWCNDDYADYRTGEILGDGSLRCVRGGCYTDLATYCRCATRNALEKHWHNKYTGFRVAAEEIE